MPLEVILVRDVHPPEDEGFVVHDEVLRVVVVGEQSRVHVDVRVFLEPLLREYGAGAALEDVPELARGRERRHAGVQHPEPGLRLQHLGEGLVLYSYY